MGPTCGKNLPRTGPILCGTDHLDVEIVANSRRQATGVELFVYCEDYDIILNKFIRAADFPAELQPQVSVQL